METYLQKINKLMYEYAGEIFVTIIIRRNKPGNKLFYI